MIRTLPLVATASRRAIHKNARLFGNVIDDMLRKYHASSPSCQSVKGDDHQQPEGHRAANQKYKGILQIQDSSNKGLGLFASRDFDVGDLVMSSKPAVTTSVTRDSHTVQIDWDRHIVMNLPAVLINHSCDANVGVRNNSTNDAYDFWAIRPITEGEELTWDYEASEWELSTPFDCGCGSAKCRGRLQGFKVNGDIIKQRYGEYYADYLKKNQELITREI